MAGRQSSWLWRLIPIAIAGAVLLFQFTSSERFVVPGTGRVARVALNEDQEAALGLEAFQQVLAESRVLQSGPAVEQVQRVVGRLAQATGAEGADFEWQVAVIQNDQANAFCLPGGKMAVFTGILPVAETDAGLATVLGHEMAHAIARHGSERMLHQQLTQTAMIGIQGSIMDMDYQSQRALMSVIGAGAQVGIILPFSRDHEMEADYLGLIYMARAGYDPRESVRFWERMASASGGGQPPEFVSTHPSHGTRIQRLQEWMPEALKEYQGR